MLFSFSEIIEIKGKGKNSDSEYNRFAMAFRSFMNESKSSMVQNIEKCSAESPKSAKQIYNFCIEWVKCFAEEYSMGIDHYDIRDETSLYLCSEICSRMNWRVGTKDTRLTKLRFDLNRSLVQKMSSVLLYFLYILSHYYDRDKLKKVMEDLSVGDASTFYLNLPEI